MCELIELLLIVQYIHVCIGLRTPATVPLGVIIETVSPPNTAGDFRFGVVGRGHL
jgi:hypothetical protein